MGSSNFVVAFACMFCFFHPALAEQLVSTADAADSNNNNNNNLSANVKTKVDFFNLDLGTYLIVYIAPNNSARLLTRKVPGDVRYVLFETHAQDLPIVLAYDRGNAAAKVTTQSLPYGTFVKGVDVGLVVLMEPGDNRASVYAFNPSADTPVEMLARAVGYTSNDPIPGGCNMEFPVAIAPYMKVAYDTFDTRIRYQRSSVGYPRDGPQPPCDTSLQHLNYELFAYFLKEKDLSRSEYYKAVKIMGSVNQMRDNAVKLKKGASESPLLVEFPTYRRIGVMFGIVVHFTSADSSCAYAVPYVPIVSYGCSLVDDTYDSCIDILTPFEWVLGVFGAIIGLLLCYFGHQFFKCSMFCFGFMTLSLIGYVVVYRFTSLNYIDVMAVTFVLGFLGGLGWVIFWMGLGYPMLSVLLPGFHLGFLLASVALFSPLGQLALFTNDVAYWTVFGCFILIVSIILISFTQTLHIVACSVIGSYGAIVLLDRFLGGTLVYIVLNVFRRAVVPRFAGLAYLVPFQTSDILLAVLWFALATIGIAVQHVFARGKPPFPPPTTLQIVPAAFAAHRSYGTISDASVADDSSPRSADQFAPSTSASPFAPSATSSPERNPLLGNPGFRKKTYYNRMQNEGDELPYT